MQGIPPVRGRHEPAIPLTGLLVCWLLCHAVMKILEIHDPDILQEAEIGNSCKGKGHCLSEYIGCAVQIGINHSAIFRTIQSSFDTFSAEGRIGIILPIYGNIVLIQKTRFGSIGFLLFNDDDAGPLRFIPDHADQTAQRNLHKVLVGLL